MIRIDEKFGSTAPSSYVKTIPRALSYTYVLFVVTKDGMTITVELLNMIRQAGTDIVAGVTHKKVPFSPKGTVLVALNTTPAAQR